MIKVGVTGGIGSGKSLACGIFRELGAPIYDSDSRSKELLNSDVGAKQAVSAIFGPEAYLDGQLNRAFIASRVFNDNTLLTALNNVIHPLVAQDFMTWTVSKKEYQYVIIESAILFESGFERLVDKIITVSAPEEIRIGRVVSRDNVSRRSVEERIANQLSDKEREERSDYIIHNTESIESLTIKVGHLDKLLRR